VLRRCPDGNSEPASGWKGNPAPLRQGATEPEQADVYRELILVIGRELRQTEQTSDERRYVSALTDELARVLRALE